MRPLLFTLSAALFLTAQSNACDKCNRVQANYYAQPYAVAPYAVAPYAVSSAPMTYVPATYSSPTQLTFVPSSAAYAPSSFAAAGYAPVSVLGPATYSTTFAAPSTQAFFVPSNVLVNSASDSPSTQSLTQQGLIDSLIGAGRPAACEFCRVIGCDSNGSGGSGRDPLTDLKDTIKGIGELIRSIKGLEKDLKDSLSSDVEVEPGDLQIAELTRLRNDLRAINAAANETQLASGDSNVK